MTTAMQTITRSVVNGCVYHSTVYRGSRYTLRRTPYGVWEISTKRLALSGNFGGVKQYDTFEQAMNACKAFKFANLQITDVL